MLNEIVPRGIFLKKDKKSPVEMKRKAKRKIIKEYRK